MLAHVLRRARQAASGGPDDAWEVLQEARAHGRAAFDAALVLLSSDEAADRSLGCHLLVVLCNPDEEEWGREVATVMAGLAVGEHDAEVLCCLATALGFARHRLGLPALVGLSTHPDSDVRQQAAQALPSCAEGADGVLLSATLLALMADPDDDVRDWATFGLGTLTDFDGPAVREGLVICMGDENLEVRDEALLGLARRRDPRLVAFLVARLEEESVGMLAVEAATYARDDRLFATLQELTTWWDVDSDLLAEALSACDPAQQARDLADQQAFLVAIEPYLQARPGVRVALVCERFELDVSLSVHDSRGSATYSLPNLLHRAGGDIASAVQAVVANLSESLLQPVKVDSVAPRNRLIGGHEPVSTT